MKKLIVVLLAALMFTTACDPSDLQKFKTYMSAEEETHCRDIVPLEQHVWGDPTAAIENWRAVTCRRGWDSWWAEAWVPFVVDVVTKESGGCPNVRRGSVIGEWQGCQHAIGKNGLPRVGKGSDSGYGQIIGLHYRTSSKNPAAGWLCKQEGLCSAEDITASPEASMTALVSMIERSGNAGWCYNAEARRYHNCRLSP